LLADGRSSLEFDIPLAHFPRVVPMLASTEGAAKGHARFGRDAGFVMVDLEVSAVLLLVCQRCLGPMRWALDASTRVALVGAPEESDAAPEGLETILAPERRVSLRDLAEEEVLLSLPIVPMHEDPAQCANSGAAEAVPAEEAEAESRQRPFERLGELLKRGE
jgi:uncharacterized protein